MDGPSASGADDDKVTRDDLPILELKLPVAVAAPEDIIAPGTTPSLPTSLEVVEDVFTDLKPTKAEELRRPEGENNVSEKGQLPLTEDTDGDSAAGAESIES